MKLSNLAAAILSIPSDLSNSTVKQLRAYASLLRIPTSIRTKGALLVELKSYISDFAAYHAAIVPVCETPPVTPPSPVEEVPSASCTEVPGTFIDTAQFLIPEPLSAAQIRVLNTLGVFPKKHALQGSEVFCYLNNVPVDLALSHVQAVSLYLYALNIAFIRTADKTLDISMTEEDFLSGIYFPGFKWNKRDRQWERTDSNGILTRIYDKTAELFRRGADSPKWLKGKLDNRDRGAFYALHTVRFEARHTSLTSLESTPIGVSIEALDYKTSQTYTGASAGAVSHISLAIKSQIKLPLEELVRALFDSLISHFDLRTGTDKRFSEFKAELKKLHPELASVISKIRRNK
jgi:hypothetical protein